MIRVNLYSDELIQSGFQEEFERKMLGNGYKKGKLALSKDSYVNPRIQSLWQEFLISKLSSESDIFGFSFQSSPDSEEGVATFEINGTLYSVELASFFNARVIKVLLNQAYKQGQQRTARSIMYKIQDLQKDLKTGSSR